GGRGGGGGRGGRGGGRGGGASRRGAGRGGSARNSERKDAQQRLRRDMRLARVHQARLAYAKRERQEAWDAEAGARMKEALRRILGQSTE
ncbi:MAG: hypothetical protein ACYTED_16960, partial [Planctomycetota bacterium]